MKKKYNIIHAASNTEWIESVQKYRMEGDWISVVNKFALATFRLLRYEEKTINWLAQEMQLTVEDLRANMNGSKEITLKTLVRIQNILGTEILSIRNIDLYLQYKDYKVVFYNEEKPYEMEDCNAIDTEEFVYLSSKDLRLASFENYFKKEIDYDYEEYAL